MPSRSVFTPAFRQSVMGPSATEAPPEPPPLPPRSSRASVYECEAPLARVPSQPTIVPGPVLAINLADLASAISPHYSVAELRQALLKASRSVDSPRPATASQGLSSVEQAVSLAEVAKEAPYRRVAEARDGQDINLSVTVDKEHSMLHVTTGSPGSEPLAIPGRQACSPPQRFTARALAVPEAEVSLEVHEATSHGHPARSFGEMTMFGVTSSFADEGSLQASLGHLADSLTGVPGSLLENYHRNEYEEEHDEENPSDRDVLLSREQVGYGALTTSAAELNQHTTIHRADEEVIVSLPSETTDLILHDPKSTAILMAMPEKPTEDTDENVHHHHLIVVPQEARPTPSNGDDSHDHHLRLMQIESELHVHDVVGKDGDLNAQDYSLNVTYSVSWLGYAILMVAIMSVASQGTAVRWLPSVAGTLTASWLMQAQAIIMLPFCVAELVAIPSKQRSSLFADWSLVRLVLATSVAQVAWASGFFVASDFTSLFRAWQLNNIHSVFIVVLAVATGRAVSRGEATGVSLALFGVLLMQIPVLFGRGMTPFFGDVVAALSSIGAIIFLELCSRLRARIPLFVMMVPISVCNAILFAIGAYFGQGGDFSISDRGAFGWLASNRIFFGLYLGGVVGCLGTVSCIAALSHLPSVVVGVAQTLMPPVGTAAAVMLGVAEAPGGFTMLGGVVLVAGVLTIAQATSKREVLVDLNQHASAVAS